MTQYYDNVVAQQQQNNLTFVWMKKYCCNFTGREVGPVNITSCFLIHKLEQLCGEGRPSLRVTWIQLQPITNPGEGLKMKQRKIQNEDGGWKCSPKQSQTGPEVLQTFLSLLREIKTLENGCLNCRIMGPIQLKWVNLLLLFQQCVTSPDVLANVASLATTSYTLARLFNMFYSYLPFLLPTRSSAVSFVVPLHVEAQHSLRVCLWQGDTMQCVQQPGEAEREPTGDLQPGLLRGATETRTSAGLRGSNTQQPHAAHRPSGGWVRPAHRGVWAQGAVLHRLPPLLQLPQAKRWDPLTRCLKLNSNTVKLIHLVIVLERGKQTKKQLSKHIVIHINGNMIWCFKI